MPADLYAALPHVNATLNGSSFVLIATGLMAIKLGHERVHKCLMLSAACVSAAFLVCYVVYHIHVGSVRFQGAGTIRTAYLVILVSHSILAAVQVPLIITTIVLGLRDRRAAHRRLARITAPIWLYVSLTGVVIYIMLYHL